MAIVYEDMKVEKVPLPAEPARKEREPKTPRVTFADRLNELKVGDYSYFREGAKKSSIGSQIFTLRKSGKISGKFKMIEYGIGGDPIHADKAGVRIWRTEAGGNVTSIAAE